jgi:hypothetical protein
MGRLIFLICPARPDSTYQSVVHNRIFAYKKVIKGRFQADPAVINGDKQRATPVVYVSGSPKD